MWRLSQRYGWGIPHPTRQIVVRAHNDIAASMQRAVQSFAAWFLPRYEALRVIFEPRLDA